MSRIAVTCLGSGAALGHGRLWSSILVNGRIILDLPPSAVPQLYRVGADFASIDYVFISHFHADHSFGIPFFLLMHHFLASRSRPVYLIGPQGLAQRTAQLSALAWPELVKKGLAPDLTVKFVEIAGDGDYRAGDLRFTAVGMEHFGFETYGYRFAVGDRAIAYTGDTGECPQLHRLIAGADIVITELTHPTPTDDPGHLDVRAVRRIAQEASGTVLATHLSGTPPAMEGVIACRDGETYVV